MQELFHEIDHWQAQNKPVALATVVQTWGSAPRGEGAKMAVTSGAEMTGSVSGGCVEGAVIEAAIQSLQRGRARLLHFGVADETAWDVGLACGGTIEIFVRPLGMTCLAQARRALEEGRASAGVSVIRGPENLLGREILVLEDGETTGSLGDVLDEPAREAARQALASGRPERVLLRSEAEGEEAVEAFIDLHLPPPVLVMVGGVHIAVALVPIAHTLGFRTIVVDPRRAFGSEARFAEADRLIQAWPEEAFRQIPLTSQTAVAMLTHDPKIDDPALQVVLPSPAFYVGALGSRRTQALRLERLLQAGLSETLVDRLHAPIGLDIGARTPEEIALSVMAEVVKAYRQPI